MTKIESMGISYDRFTQPTAEYTDGYEDIDEIATIYDAIGDE